MSTLVHAALRSTYHSMYSSLTSFSVTELRPYSLEVAVRVEEGRVQPMPQQINLFPRITFATDVVKLVILLT